MDSLFKLGDIVSVAVVSVSKSEETNKYSLILSLSPNKTMNGRYIRKFYCTFSSELNNVLKDEGSQTWVR